MRGERGHLGGLDARAALGRRRVLAALCFGAIAPRRSAAASARAPAHDVTLLGERARRAGLRVLDGERLLLVTDRPPRGDDGVDGLPTLFAEAFASWCSHFSVGDDDARGFRACGCLMSDRDVFRAAGLLPVDGSVPDFANGFCDRNLFWFDDQTNPAYRRHLLFHEGVHAFTFVLRRLSAPTWYMEGIAELLATHRLEDGRFVPTPIPLVAADVEQLGRIESLRALRRDGGVPGLADVFAVPPSPRHEIASYAASWAATALLSLHPAHAATFRSLEEGPLDARLDERLAALPGWDMPRAARDFDAFTDEVDYGFDFGRSGIDWSPGRPLSGRVRATIAADRGWQPTGVTLSRGERVEFVATGRCGLGTAGDLPLEGTADGISLRWYRGRPVGRMLLGQWSSPPEGGRPRFVVVAEGAKGRFAAIEDGVLQAKVNAPPAALPLHRGALDLHLRPEPDAAR